MTQENNVEKSDLPRSINAFVEDTLQRRKQRRIDALGDEIRTYPVEIAAIVQDDEKAEKAIRTFKSYISSPENNPEQFTEDFPEFADVDFGNLAISSDIGLIQVGEGAAIPQERQLEAPDSDLSEISLEGKKYEKLFKKHPAINALFSNESEWIEHDNERYIDRLRIASFLVKKDTGKRLSYNVENTSLHTICKKLEEIDGKKVGRRIKGRGSKYYLTEEEALKAFSFIDETIGEAGFFSNYALTGKKRLPIRLEMSKRAKKKEDVKKVVSKIDELEINNSTLRQVFNEDSLWQEIDGDQVISFSVFQNLLARLDNGVRLPEHTAINISQWILDDWIRTTDSNDASDFIVMIENSRYLPLDVAVQLASFLEQNLGKLDSKYSQYAITKELPEELISPIKKK